MPIALDVKSHYSFLASSLAIPSYVKEGKKRGYQTLALADDHSMMGAVEFYQACLKEGIKPILGLRMTLELHRILKEVRVSIPLLLFAKNEAGYQNLLTIASLSDEAFMTNWLKRKPDDLSNLALVVSLTQELSLATMQELGNFFDEKHLPVYIGLDPLVLRGEYLDDLEETFKEWAYVSPIALRKIRYIKTEDAPALAVLKAIRQATVLDLQHLSQGPDYLRDPKNLAALFEHPCLKEGVNNLEDLVHQCRLKIPLHQHLLPRFFKEDSQHQLASQRLKELCQSALKQKNCQEKAYQDRLDMELSVIDDMGFSDYFLIVWDIMRYARQSKIITSPGRGSAAGALVTYLLDITAIDPIKHQLLFERFLNKERRNMPDIDLDFPDNRREDILRYVLKRYGREHVAQIATVGSFQVRQALRDVGRVAGLSPKELGQLVKMIPNRPKITLSEALKESEALRRLATVSPYDAILRVVPKIEGLAKHQSIHAAGVVLTEAPLLSYTALFEKESTQLPVTQFQMKDIEQIGLLKIDFLGIRNLTTVDRALKAIRRHQPLTLADIPLDDPSTFKLFQRGDTRGVFQFESEGIRRLLRRVKPETLEDLTAVNALYRPGPMEQIPSFIARKHGKEKICYIHPQLAPILDQTYGVMIYQEQVMQVTQVVAGFSLAQADLLRRAMSKKKPDLILKQKRDFLEGAMRHGYSSDEAQQIFQFIEQFANYGFNRSHAMVYSVLAYQMAYLKCHYPLAFYSALLESVSLTSDKGKLYLAEMRHRRLAIKGPDLNVSSMTDSIDPSGIRLGLSHIKRLPRELLERLLQHRQEFGPYTCLEDVVSVGYKKFLKASYFEALILSGSMDGFGANRQSLLETLPSVLLHFSFFGQQGNLLEDDPEMAIQLVDCEEMPLLDRLQAEVDYLGLIVSPHPVQPYQSMALEEGWWTLEEVWMNHERKGNLALFVVHQIERIKTKTGELMAFLQISDASFIGSAILFPKLYYRYMSQLKEGQVYLGRLKKETGQRDKVSLILEEVTPISLVEKGYRAKKQVLYLNILPEKAEQLPAVRRLIYDHPGQTSVIFVRQPQRQAFQDPHFSHVEVTNQLLFQLKRLIGDENVRVQ